MKTLTPPQIIEALAEYLKISVAELSQKAGYERAQSFYDVQSGKTKNISPKMANNIVSAFPEINKDWLLTGNGEMLIEEEEEEPYLRAERNKYGLSLQRIQELTSLPLKTLKAYDNGSKEMPDDILEAFENLFERIENEYNEREEENNTLPVLITDDMVSSVKVPFYEVDFAGGFTSPEMFS